MEFRRPTKHRFACGIDFDASGDLLQLVSQASRVQIDNARLDWKTAASLSTGRRSTFRCASALFRSVPRSSFMSINPVAVWHQVAKARDVGGLDDLLAEDAVFYSPVVHTPQVGKAVTTKYLAAAFRVFFNESFQYVRELAGDRDAVLEFVVELEGIKVNGVDMIKWNDAGKIVEFKVMLRPLKAINLIHQKMAAALEAKP
jgi:hypothetical protein